jgi:hypothetical protein
MTWIILLVMAHDDMMDKGTDIFKECLENTTRIFVDEAWDTLDTATTSETTNGRLGDTLDVVAQDQPVARSSGLSKTLMDVMLDNYD